MKKTNVKKLELHKESISRLDQEQVKQVGGASASCTWETAHKSCWC
ncbi:MAG: class I lanthipeptide [Acidobacteriota bacterium]|nr:class I lanthipeptide [Acidobacteriota bacterium]